MGARNIPFGKKSVIFLVLAIAFLSFIGGVMAVGKMPVDLSSVFEDKQTDMEWARGKGYIASSAIEEANPTQAEFLKMVMTSFGDVKDHPEFAVAKVKGHWAEAIYSSGKANSVISCSCEIKPDQTITVREASDFVVRAINKMAGKQVVGFLNIEQLLPQKEGGYKRSITFGDAATIIRELDGYLKMSPEELQGGGVGNEKKNGNQSIGN